MSEPARRRNDRLLVVGGAADTLALLRLASIRSDEILLVAEAMTAAVRRFAETFAVEVCERDLRDGDFAGVSAALVALEGRAQENAVVQRARRHGVPLHVAGRPLVSDFTLLDMVERQPASFAARVTAP